MLAASSGSKAFYAPPRRDVRPQRGSRRLQPARASSSSSTSSNIYKPRVPFVDLYEVLALKPSATDGEVKTAYRILQKAVHPDLAGEYASAAAALVNKPVPAGYTAVGVPAKLIAPRGIVAEMKVDLKKAR